MRRGNEDETYRTKEDSTSEIWFSYSPGKLFRAAPGCVLSMCSFQAVSFQCRHKALGIADIAFQGIPRAAAMLQAQHKSSKVLSQDLKQSTTLQKQKMAAESSSAHPHACPSNFDHNIHSGGTGNKGGKGGHTGDEGGGTGGEDGAGDKIGGRGGTGLGPRFSHQLLSIDGKDLPPLSVAEFCQEL
ncbi:hypothetical protein B0H19DRAFT_1077828 [Mycena capillaripes]|nr:hypothetical protein B0H19DRAFT_1077828 [Mycena capillaripes]